MGGPPPAPVLCKILGTVIRTNATSFKANYGDGTYAGTFRGVRQAEAFIEQSISPGGAPMQWVLEDRIDFLEAYHVGVLCQPPKIKAPLKVAAPAAAPGGAPAPALAPGGIFGGRKPEELLALINPAFAKAAKSGWFSNMNKKPEPKPVVP